MNADKPPCFVDSNIWLYALLDMQEEKKRSTAAQIIAQATIVISTQVINEVCRNLLKAGSFTEAEITEYIESAYNRYRVIELTKDVLLQASALRGQYAFSFWDSMIIASALAANVSIVYSEDMQDQLLVESRLRIVNPFEYTMDGINL